MHGDYQVIASKGGKFIFVSCVFSYVDTWKCQQLQVEGNLEVLQSRVRMN